MRESPDAFLWDHFTSLFRSQVFDVPRFFTVAGVWLSYLYGGARLSSIFGLQAFHFPVFFGRRYSTYLAFYGDR